LCEVSTATVGQWVLILQCLDRPVAIALGAVKIDDKIGEGIIGFGPLQQSTFRRYVAKCYHHFFIFAVF